MEYWFGWLSKTNLDAPQIHDYALTFAHNQLAEDDVPYFTHDFLQSMGVAVAKHRLEILKLARKNKARRIMHPVLWFMFVCGRTKKYVSDHVGTMIRRDRKPPPLSLVIPRRNHSLRWKVAMLQRNKTPSLGLPRRRDEHDRGSTSVFGAGNGVLMLTNGSPGVESRSSGSSWVDSAGVGESGRGFGTNKGESWSSGSEEIKWDSMFKNLNPT